jgi:hypothetical protein
VTRCSSSRNTLSVSWTSKAIDSPLTISILVDVKPRIYPGFDPFSGLSQTRQYYLYCLPGIQLLVLGGY